MSTTVTPTKQFTAKALDNELSRRKNNRKRDEKKPQRSYVLRALSKAQMDEIKAGAIVAVSFRSGRVEHVGLK